MPFLSIFFHFVLFFPFCPLSFPMNYSFLMYFFALFRLSPPSSFFVSPSPPFRGPGLPLPPFRGPGASSSPLVGRGGFLSLFIASKSNLDTALPD